MPDTQVVAMVTPAAGKGPRLLELLTDLSKQVHTNEQGALRYIVTKRVDSEDASNPDIIVIECYKDDEAANAHMGAGYTKEFFATAEKEGLVAEGKPPVIARTVGIAGFDKDRTLLQG